MAIPLPEVELDPEDESHVGNSVAECLRGMRPITSARWPFFHLEHLKAMASLCEPYLTTDKANSVHHYVSKIQSFYLSLPFVFKGFISSQEHEKMLEHCT